MGKSLTRRFELTNVFARKLGILNLCYRKVRNTASSVSRPQPLDLPAIPIAAVAQAVVQAAAAALPEFDLLRDHAVAAPEVGDGDFRPSRFRAIEVPLW